MSLVSSSWNVGIPVSRSRAHNGWDAGADQVLQLFDKFDDNIFGSPALYGRERNPAGQLVQSLMNQMAQSPVLHVDVRENPTQYCISADMPGVKKEDIKLKVNNRMLEISAERNFENTNETDLFTRRERYHGKFSRTLSLPDDADESSVSAKFDHGVLHIDVGRSKGKTPSQIIQVA
jgi:HSP20 family protein